ncbi:MAG TPA: protein kinase, partial [Polyangiales bacterium]|nr:protein kinase [Polyangiales bacterium]
MGISSDPARTIPRTSAPVAPAAPPASIAGRYTVLERLGSGGMGVVSRVRDESSGNVLALKLLVSKEAGRLKRRLEALFEREYHTLARLRHPRIIEVYDYGVTDTGPYYTMELLDGGDLQQLSPLPWQAVCQHLCDVASSLALLHARRLVHRDITPRNIRLTGEGRAKLIDFGALSDFGAATDLVGTPLCMAPEVFHRGLLDQRADLFALGVVGYYALTGQHAFPVRSLDELPQYWKRGATPPSQLRSDIPPALDALLMSMLHSDPLSRPMHAAHVIDQLCAIAGLSVADVDLAAESYLASGKLVGREVEQEWIERRMERALSGQGAEALITGAPGIGKTRLLREVGLDAQVRGMLVLEADAQTTSGAFGVAAALAEALLERGGALARECAGGHAGLLAQLSPSLRERFADATLEPLASNPAEQRARFQAALCSWIAALARQRPLLIAVDNLQAADESSAAFLVTLGHAAASDPLLLLLALRSGDAIVAPQPVAALRARSGQLKLDALNARACEHMVQSLFGEVANSARLGKLLYEKSAGNPQHCMELAQLLAKKQIAKYVAGAWELPGQVSSEELPDRMEDILSAKLAGLPAAARSLAETLCIHDKPVSIELCLAFAESLPERDAHAALDELLSQQILVSAGGSYQFAQQALRSALLANISDERARTLHRHAADVLSISDDLALRMQRGWHLLRAGEDEQGAELLASTGRAFLTTAGAREEGQNVIAALRAALDVYERHGRSQHERAALLFPLIMLCYYCPDNRLILRYAPQALRLGLDITGLALAQKLRRVIGRRLALRFGMWLAGIRLRREQARRGLTMTLQQAVGTLSSIVPASIGAFGCHYDTPGAERIGELAESLSLFEPQQLPALMHTWMQGQRHLIHGLESDSYECMQRVLERLQHPAMQQALGDAHYRSLRGGAMFMLGLTACYRGSRAALQIADDMASLGVRLWTMVADQIRLLHHAYRGEAERVQHYRACVERCAMQGGPTWHTELFWPAAMLNGDVLCNDTIAVRHIYQQLERVAQDVPTLQVHADSARAAYLSLRGDHAQAIALYEQIVRELPPRRSIAWLPVRGHFARALNRVGDHARARELLLETFRHVTDADREVRVLCFEARRQLAVAEAGLGQPAEAAAAIERMLREYAVDDNPLLLGLLHETAAECALRLGDCPRLTTHLGMLEVLLRSTGNPVLIAYTVHVKQQLEAAAVAAGLAPPSTQLEITLSMPAVGSAPRDATYQLGELSAAPDRPRYALELLIQHTQARGGCLYLLDGSSLLLAAASVVDEPP